MHDGVILYDIRQNVLTTEDMTYHMHSAYNKEKGFSFFRFNAVGFHYGDSQ